MSLYDSAQKFLFVILLNNFRLKSILGPRKMLTRSMAKLILQSPTGPLSLTFVSPSPSPVHNSRLVSSLPLPGLHNLPQELLVTILSYLSLPDIGNLSLCGSLRIRDQITTWMTSRNFCNKVTFNLTSHLLNTTAAHFTRF